MKWILTQKWVIHVKQRGIAQHSTLQGPITHLYYSTQEFWSNNTFHGSVLFLLQIPRMCQICRWTLKTTRKSETNDHGNGSESRQHYPAGIPGQDKWKLMQGMKTERER